MFGVLALVEDCICLPFLSWTLSVLKLLRQI